MRVVGWVGLGFGRKGWSEGSPRYKGGRSPAFPEGSSTQIFNLWLSVLLQNLNLFAAGLFKKRCWARSDLGTTFILQTRPAVRIGRRSETTPWRALKSIQQTEYWSKVCGKLNINQMMIKRNQKTEYRMIKTSQKIECWLSDDRENQGNWILIIRWSKVSRKLIE